MSPQNTLPYIQLVSPYQKMKPTYPLYRVVHRTGEGLSEQVFTQSALLEWAEKQTYNVFEYVGYILENLSDPVSEFGGLSCQGQALIMGVVNVTPDSFSDGGLFVERDQAIEQCHKLVEAGADILDIGGESTRPGADPVSLDQEMDRVLPVIEAVKGLGAKLSIDTRHAKVMEAAIKAGAHMINDVTALEGEGSLEMALKLDVPVILMHMQGDPQSMQDHPQYDHCLFDVYDYLKSRIDVCLEIGISTENIAVDPGIGFGKTLAHNMELMNGLSLYHGLGCPVLLGASRKSFIAKIDEAAPVDQRLGGSLAAVLKGAQAGVQLVRVHDVFETRQALKVWEYN